MMYVYLREYVHTGMYTYIVCMEGETILRWFDYKNFYQICTVQHFELIEIPCGILLTKSTESPTMSASQAKIRLPS